jgi:single-strand DNA-binding protein
MESTMANLNRWTGIGRLTRDVETRSFSNGGKVAKIGFAVDAKSKKNEQTGKWETEPCFLDVEAFNRGENGKLADQCEQFLSKGKQCYIEGKLVMQNWTDQQGQKRNKILVEADRVEFLDGGQKQQAEPQQRHEAPNPDAPAPTLFGDDPFAS